MKNSSPEKFNDNGQTDGVSSGGSLDDLVSFARNHFATDFPNPERIDCPSPEIYSDLVSRKELPDEQLQTHLRSCSECFRTYSALLNTQRKPVVAKTRWMPPVVWRTPALSFGLAIVLFCAVLFGVYRFYRTNPLQPADRSVSSEPMAKVPAAPETPATLNQNDRTLIGPEPERKPPPQAAKSPSPMMIAAHSVVINFGRQRVSRSAPQREIEPAIFVAGLNRVRVKLNAESPRGEYGLSLNDPFGKEVTPPVAGTFDGTVLRTDLDLSLVTPGRYLICITRAAEVPDCLPAIVKPTNK